MGLLTEKLVKWEGKPPIRWSPTKPELLLLPNVPKPIHGLAPRVVLGQTWWNAERNAAYRSTEFHCLACGVDKFEAKFHHWLEGHEVYDVDYLAGRCKYVGAVPLCHACHCFIHDGRMKALLEKGEMPQSKYDEVLAHGGMVLKEAGLVKGNISPPAKIAEWCKWRLAVDGAEYPPIHASFVDWCRHYECDPSTARMQLTEAEEVAF